MRVTVQSPADLGVLIRALRKAAGVRQDDLAASVGVSKQFATDVEHGKPTAQVGLLLHVLEELGARVEVEIPDSVGPAFREISQRFAAQGGRHQTRSPRRGGTATRRVPAKGGPP